MRVLKNLNGKHDKIYGSEVVAGTEENPVTFEEHLASCAEFTDLFKNVEIEYVYLAQVEAGEAKHRFDMPPKTTRILFLHANEIGHFSIINLTRFASTVVVNTVQQFGGAGIVVTRNTNGDASFIDNAHAVRGIMITASQ